MKPVSDWNWKILVPRILAGLVLAAIIGAVVLFGLKSNQVWNHLKGG